MSRYWKENGGGLDTYDELIDERSGMYPELEARLDAFDLPSDEQPDTSDDDAPGIQDQRNATPRQPGKEQVSGIEDNQPVMHGRHEAHRNHRRKVASVAAAAIVLTAGTAGAVTLVRGGHVHWPASFTDNLTPQAPAGETAEADR